MYSNTGESVCFTITYFSLLHNQLVSVFYSRSRVCGASGAKARGFRNVVAEDTWPRGNRRAGPQLHARTVVRFLSDKANGSKNRPHDAYLVHCRVPAYYQPCSETPRLCQLKNSRQLSEGCVDAADLGLQDLFVGFGFKGYGSGLMV